MAINSMTGFGKKELSLQDFTLSCEIKSVNHRFKDIRFRLPPLFSPIEFELRKLLDSEFYRGSFEVVINFKYHPDSTQNLPLDEEKVVHFTRKIKELTASLQISLTVSLSDFLRSEFMIPPDESNKELYKALKQLFIETIELLKISRKEEGEKLKQVIDQHLIEFKHHQNVIGELASFYQKDVETRLQKKLQEWNSRNGGTLDQSRLGQELIYYLEKLDVSEELNRMRAHLLKMGSLFNDHDNGEIGRQLDFLVQELNREVNTIGAKSGHSEISNAVVQMKVQLEKIREQALNLE